MLKILLVYYEPQPSGQTTHVLSLARGLDRHRHHLTVILPENLEWSSTVFRQAGVKVVPLPLRKMVWKRRAVTTLTRMVREQHYDIVHVHSQEAGLLARIVARLAGAKAIIYTPQTIDIRRVQWRWLYAVLERALARISDAIVSVSESDRGRLIQWGIPTNKIVTIPNGIDLPRFGEPVDVDGLRQSLGLTGNLPLVMQVGRLSVQKDPLTFIEGAAQVARECPEAQFVLLGSGPLRDAVATRIGELGLDARVHLVEWREDAFRLTAVADVVTLTSRWEGMPYAVLEAMAWSRPVVATSVNGCPEIVLDGVTGFLALPGDAEGWAKCVIDLLSDPAKAILMGKRGRRRVEERFGMDKMIAHIEKLYLQTKCQVT